MSPSDATMPYRALFELSPDASILFVDGAVTHANGAAARLLGAGSIADLVGRESTELLHPDCFSEVEQRAIALMEERVHSIRANDRYVRLDGRAVDVEAMVARASCLEGKAFIVCLRDLRAQGERATPLYCRESAMGAEASERTIHLVPPDDVVGAWQARYALTSAEALVLRNGVRGLPRSAITVRFGVAPATVKKHVHNLVQKTGDASLDAAVYRVLREAMERLSESTPSGE
jgi:PAS domain S-box-containing protein